MKLLRSCCLAALAGFALPALACEQPSMVEVPDGETSSMEELLEAQQNVNGYMSSMDDYLTCLNGDLEAAGEDAPEQFQALMVQRHNSAVAEMEAVAEAFNAQIQAFRAANPDE